MFTGVSAFPITPLNRDTFSHNHYAKIINRVADAGVNSICAMGSTGLYPYLNHAEKQSVIQIAVEHSQDIPVLVGIGSLRLREVLENADQAQRLGAKGLLLAPISYQRLSDDEVFFLYQEVSRHTDLPICVYDNPAATHFTFSDELHFEIAKLKNIASIKFPGMAFDINGEERVETLRKQLPASVKIGVSGDAFAASGIQSGCDVWYSVLAGLFPRTALHLYHQAKQCTPTQAIALSKQYQDLWQLFDQNMGGMRVLASAAEILGYAESPCLPAPLKGLDSPSIAQLEKLIETLELI